MNDKSFYESSADENYYFNFHKARNNFVTAHYHSNVEIVFVISGKVKAIINGVERILTKGEIAVSNSFDVHCYSGEDESEIFVLVFGDIFQSKIVGKGKSFNNFLSICEKTTDMFKFLEVFHHFSEDGNLLMKIGFVNLIVGMLIKNYNDDFVDKIENNNYFVDILNYIGENFTDDLKLESIALNFGYTKNHFSMLFNKFTGMHLRDYLNRLRIEKVELMRKENSKIPITQIALKCGFNSLNTYYRALSRIAKKS